MSLSDLAALGSFISGIAVVISFVFLGLQIRQADKNQKEMLASDWASRATEHRVVILSIAQFKLFRQRMVNLMKTSPGWRGYVVQRQKAEAMVRFGAFVAELIAQADAVMPTMPLD
jgi:hypothetical protein